MYNNFHTELVHTCKSLLSKFYTKHENALSFTCTTCLELRSRLQQVRSGGKTAMKGKTTMIDSNEKQ